MGETVVPLRPYERTITQPAESASLASGGGNGHDSVMERIVRLEEWAKQSEQRTGRIEGKLDQIVQTLAKMPTINGLWGMIATTLLAAVSIVGAVVAVFAFNQDRFTAISERATQPPAPIIIQLPPAPAPQPEQPKK